MKFKPIGELDWWDVQKIPENQAPGCTKGPMAPMFSTAPGTRDGNVKSRFFSFVRGAFGSALGADPV